MPTTQTLPHWDMTPVYPSLQSAEFERGFAQGVQDINELAELFDLHFIMEQPPIAVDASVVRTFEMITERYNSVLDTTRTLSTYISCFVTTNSQDDLAQAKMSELQLSLVRLSQLGTRFTAWIGSLDVEALIAQSALARDHAYALQRAKREANHLMSPAEEALATALNESSGTAWAKLHGNLTSQLWRGTL